MQGAPIPDGTLALTFAGHREEWEIAGHQVSLQITFASIWLVFTAVERPNQKSNIVGAFMPIFKVWVY